MMHACSICSSPKQLPITWHTRTIDGTIHTLPIFILVVLTFKTYVMRLVYLQKNTAYNHFWTLRASAHERPPCVLRHTGNAYAVFHIFTYTLPSTIEMAPKRSTLNGRRCIHHNNVFTSRTLALRDIQG